MIEARRPWVRRLLAGMLCGMAAGGAGAAQDLAAARAAFDGYWQVKFERQRTGTSLIEELPPGAVFIDDAGGLELGLGDFAGLKLSEQAQREIREYDYQEELKHENSCRAPSVPFYMQAPFPIEIHVGSEMIVIQIEYFDLYRIIFMDGRGHPPADAPHSKSGHSIGRWEGDTLAVDTTHIQAGTLMNNGLNHSDNIRMVEKFRLSPDRQTLWMTQVYEDPEVFEGIGARYMAWTRVEGEYIWPYDCDPSFGN